MEELFSMTAMLPPLTREQRKLADELDADLCTHGICIWKRDASGRAVRIDPKDFYEEEDDNAAHKHPNL